MSQETEQERDVQSVSLQSAFLCVDCESVSNTHCDECPVCGSHSLLSLSGMLGGTLLDHKASRLRKRVLLLFDLDITIHLKHMEGRELSPLLEKITSIIGPKIGRGSASLHVKVEPFSTNGMGEEPKAA